MITARHEYMDRPTLESDLSCAGDKGVTKQADLKDCDINLIMRRYEKTGYLPDLIVKDGRYGDFSEVPDYQEACNIVKHADEQFQALDVEIRNRFSNDPAKFLAFVTDPKNIDEIDKMGLLKPEVKQARLDARIAAQKAADEAAKAAAVKPAQ
ncbi:MAG: internal scaffolding protein [Microvirus sp.]|nr:MAG: internal scaffolding protein [Microvirus sp.]